MRKNIYRFCAVLSLLLLLCMGGIATAWAEEVYTVTAQELNLLETNLSKLESINKMQQEELKLQKSMLSQAKFDLDELQNALSTCKLELTKAQNSLESANRLLLKYEQEEKSRLRKIKRQRNLAYTLTAGLAYVYVKEVRR